MRKPILHSWSFKTDQINSYAWIDEFLSEKECVQIVKFNKSKTRKGRVNKDDKVNEKIRSSYIKFLSPDATHAWLFKRLSSAILDLNNKYFNFDITGLLEGIQYTNYKTGEGHYQRHVDCMFDGIVRKLSISIQLTDPTKYEGGDLNLYWSDDPVTMKKNKGSLFIFPSYMLHEVTPVTKGERNSLVCWVNGPQFK